MKALGVSYLSGEMLLRLWWKRLPLQISIAIDQEVERKDEAEAVAKADRLYARFLETTPRPSVSSVASLSAQSHGSRERSKSRGRGRGRSRSRGRGGKPRLCHPHYKFKEKCTSCHGPPCPQWEDFAKQNCFPADYEEYRKLKREKKD